MTGRIAIAAIAAVFGWAILSALAEGVWDATRGMRRHNKPPAAGPPPSPLPGSLPGLAASPPPVLGHGRLLKSIDVFDEATVVTDWLTETSEVFPAECKEQQP